MAVFSEIFGNPVRSQVMAGAAAFKAHRADAVIGVGGGAALDVAKAIALMAHHDGDILEYAWDHPQVRAITQPIPWFVALPTTAGTGSEVGRSSVVGDDVTHVKKIIFSPLLLAKAVFADPELTLDLPASDHRGDGHGRADAQRRVVPVRRPTIRCATASRWKACASPRGRCRAP